MKVLFAATDSIAVPLLEKLVSEGLAGAVFTAPDAPGKRGKGIVETPVKVKAKELGLEVFTPEHLNRAEREIVKKTGADCLLSFSYGRIFGPKFLSLFRYTFNVHPSILPSYRGCSPIFNVIRNNERETAITVQEISPGIDEGRIYAMERMALDGTETSASLESRISSLAPSLVLPVLVNAGSSTPFPQSGQSSYTGFIRKEDGRIDWNESASSIHALIRACYPWPKAWCMYNGSPFIITGVHSSSFLPFEPCTEKPGTVVALDRKKGLRIATGDGYLYLTRVLPPMKKEMDVSSFINGARNFIGTVLE